MDVAYQLLPDSLHNLLSYLPRVLPHGGTAHSGLDPFGSVQLSIKKTNFTLPRGNLIEIFFLS